MSEIKRFLLEEDAIGVVEIILILVILVALVVIFREKITSMVSDAFSNITTGSETINEEITLDE